MPRVCSFIPCKGQPCRQQQHQQYGECAYVFAGVCTGGGCIICLSLLNWERRRGGEAAVPRVISSSKTVVGGCVCIHSDFNICVFQREGGGGKSGRGRGMRLRELRQKSRDTVNDTLVNFASKSTFEARAHLQLSSARRHLLPPHLPLRSARPVCPARPTLEMTSSERSILFMSRSEMTPSTYATAPGTSLSMSIFSRLPPSLPLMACHTILPSCLQY